MEELRKQVAMGNVELARLNDKQQPVPMEMNELEAKRQRMNKQGLMVQQLKQMSIEQKVTWMLEKKNAANLLFKENKLDEAIEVYLQAMLGLEIEDKNEQRLKETNLEYKYPIMLNIVTCMYKKGEYGRGLQLCNRILAEKDGQKHIKALFKKANCLIGFGDYNQAKSVIFSSVKLLENQLTAKTSDISKDEFYRLYEELKAKVAQEKRMYQRIFKEKEEDIHDNEENNLMSGDRSTENEEQVKVHPLNSIIKFMDCCKNLYLICRSYFPSQFEKKQ